MWFAFGNFPMDALYHELLPKADEVLKCCSGFFRDHLGELLMCYVSNFSCLATPGMIHQCFSCGLLEYQCHSRLCNPYY